MTITPRYPAYSEIDDDELLDIGAELESKLAAIQAEIDSLEPSVLVEGQRLRKSGIKLGINATLGLAGAAAAPITFGWSLLLTLGCTGDRLGRQRLRE